MNTTMKYLVTFLFIGTMVLAQNADQFNFFDEVKLKISNPSEIQIKDALVAIETDKIIKAKEYFNEDAFIVYLNDVEVANQLYSKNGKNSIVFVSDFGPNEVKEFTIKFLKEGKLIKEYTKRTYAELAMKFDAVFKDKKFTSDHFENFSKVVVPKIHTDHDALFKYEGPGWESELVGYRFYLDWRNATDIFGKKENQLVLKNVGVNDVIATDDSYHEMQEWGMDIFKVGTTLGIGSIGMLNDSEIEKVSKTDLVTCEIVNNGPIISDVKTDYFGWKVGNDKFDLSSILSIAAGSRLTNVCLDIKDNADNIVTGLAKHENTDFLKSDSDGDWQFIALYGKQTLADDNLGIVLFYNGANLIKQSEDDINYFIVLKPDNQKVNYKFAAAWEQEQDGIKNKEEFIKYINDELVKLNNPLNIEIL